MIRLDRETHTYSPNYPSVTTVLGHMIDKTYFTKEGRERGKLVHLACEYFDQGDLDYDSLDPELCGYVQAYMAYRRFKPVEVEWIEVPMADPTGSYAGTSDRIVRTKPDRSLTDLKTGAEAPWHRLQTAAYLNMLEDPMSYRRFALYLRSDGTFRLKEHPRIDYPSDLAAFKAALVLFNWKESQR